MTKEQFYAELENVNASRTSRLNCASLVSQDLSLFPFLIDTLFEIDNKDSCKAAWVLEFVCNDYIYAIVPYLDTFTKNIHKIQSDSAIRPIAKICSFIVQTYYSKEKNTFNTALTAQHKKRLIETNFDWMINEHKVAVKVFAMETLFHLGKENQWIHKELEPILTQHFHKESAAYKSRAKRILQKIKRLKHKLL
ncbi:adenylosuccinate lyase [Flavobacteriaceae bacterium XHP0103]|uniref:adenylosuccinate lyase n=1 Tax=Marixanthotalea marina TaxID=2844359 RepID=UPI002989F6E5|nr:adenylosuccinate lyase [Marixanthotalea marina]MBU3821692.1 adenylosuccinate lyase [Marixanthotalea marina]